MRKYRLILVTCLLWFTSCYGWDQTRIYLYVKNNADYPITYILWPHMNHKWFPGDFFAKNQIDPGKTLYIGGVYGPKYNKDFDDLKPFLTVAFYELDDTTPYEDALGFIDFESMSDPARRGQATVTIKDSFNQEQVLTPIDLPNSANEQGLNIVFNKKDDWMMTQI